MINLIILKSILSSYKIFYLFIFITQSLVWHNLCLRLLLSQTFVLYYLCVFLLESFLFYLVCYLLLHFWLDLLLFYIDFCETVLNWVQMMLLSWNLYCLFVVLSWIFVLSRIEVSRFFPFFLAPLLMVCYQILIRFYIVLIWRSLESFLFRPNLCFGKIFHQLNWILRQIFWLLVQGYFTFDLG